MQTISITIPQTLSDQYVDVNTLQSLMIQNFVVAEYQRGSLSLRESAAILELTYNQFIDLLGQYHLSFINADKSEIVSSYHAFHSFMQNRR
jgi:hypothetical protein